MQRNGLKRQREEKGLVGLDWAVGVGRMWASYIPLLSSVKRQEFGKSLLSVCVFVSALYASVFVHTLELWVGVTQRGKTITAHLPATIAAHMSGKQADRNGLDTLWTFTKQTFIRVQTFQWLWKEKPIWYVVYPLNLTKMWPLGKNYVESNAWMKHTQLSCSILNSAGLHVFAAARHNPALAGLWTCVSAPWLLWCAKGLTPFLCLRGCYCYKKTSPDCSRHPFHCPVESLVKIRKCFSGSVCCCPLSSLL